jgi:hypothetical protein
MKTIFKNIAKKVRFFNPQRYFNWKVKGFGKSEDFPHYLSVALIVKNEAEYIAEWIEYHLLVGVTKFYIYDNDSTDNLKEVLLPYIKDVGYVEYIYYPGKNRQIYMCNDAVKRSEKDTFWLAVIDTDEFIVPLSTSTLPEFLRDFEDVPGLEINWLLYGSNGHKNKTEGLVMERFKTHALPEYFVNRNVKSIHNPRAVFYANAHNAVYFGNKISVNTDKEPNIRHFLDRNGCFDKIVINHYFTRSLEEYLLKQRAGRADYGDPKYRDMNLFNEQDRNDIYDTTMDKYIPAIKEKIKER